MMKTRKESQAKFEAEVKASEPDINKATTERNWKGYINATDIAQMRGSSGMDGTDYIVRLYNETTGSNVEVLNGQYCWNKRAMNGLAENFV